MTKRKFYKTVIQVKVLSEQPYEYENLSQVASDISDGDCSGEIENTITNEKLNGKQAATVLQEQGSDPEFFRLDKDGNDLEE